MTEKVDRRRGPRAKPPAAHVEEVLVAPVAVVTDTLVRHVHHVHFLVDGVTALDKVYVRGEEAVVDSDDHPLAHNARGECCFALDHVEQMTRFGRVLWAEGPWPYAGFDPDAPTDNAMVPLTEEEKEILRKENKTRGLKTPVGGRRARDHA